MHFLHLNIQLFLLYLLKTFLSSIELTFCFCPKFFEHIRVSSFGTLSSAPVHWYLSVSHQYYSCSFIGGHNQVVPTLQFFPFQYLWGFFRSLEFSYIRNIRKSLSVYKGLRSFLCQQFFSTITLVILFLSFWDSY